MPQIPGYSPATGKPTPDYFIHTLDSNFVDNHGRTLLLRGVNLSGASKAPVDQQSQVQEGFWEEAEKGGLSFVGRPLNVDDGSADIHLQRLKGWGFNMLRFPITWESLEHEGPGRYDYDFMDYTIRVLRKCKEYGFKVYLDPHQDVWSRFSGGSGAPYWTIPACGINPRNFTATQAAIVHCEYPSTHDADPASFPAMIWSTNYGRLLSQTIFTLFFAGRDFAPLCVIDGINIQDYLQQHYIAAFGALADRIRDAGGLYDECIIGWDSMNEPFEGLVGWQDLNVAPTSQGSTLKKGTYPSPAQSFRLGMGQEQTVDHWSFGTFGPKKDGTVTVDPQGYKIWSEPSTEPNGVHSRWGWKRDPKWKLGTCVWALHGVWDVETGYILRPDYFQKAPRSSEAVEFVPKYWKPHFEVYAQRLRQAHPEAILFVGPPVFALPPPVDEEHLKGRCAYSGHYYDGLTLITRHWSWFNADALGLLRGKYRSTIEAVKIGEGAIRKSLQEQLHMLQTDADILGPYPTIIGEIGTPFDMDGKRSYGWTDNGRYLGDYSRQQRALDASLNAADGPNRLNYTVWTYVPDNSHEWGDGWNMEDLSLWSVDDMRKSKPRIGASMSASSSTASSIRNGKGKARTFVRQVSDSVASSTATLQATYVQSEQPSPVSNWRNAYDFLTDGARAVQAFSRPFPVATVGLPHSIEFNIKKAEFKLTVLVRPEDAPVRSRNADGAGSDDDLATEIYVPVVTYAHPNLLPANQDEDGFANKDSVESLSGTAPSFSALNLADSAQVDVSVEVSAGRFAIEGQTLRWWYPVPSEGREPVEYTLTLTRGAGPIKSSSSAADGTGGLCSWLDTFCPPDVCTVM